MKKKLLLVFLAAVMSLVSCEKEAETAKFIGTYGGTFTSETTISDMDGQETMNDEGPINGQIVVTATEVENEINIVAVAIGEGTTMPAFRAQVDGNNLVIPEMTIEETIEGFTIPMTYSGDGVIDGDNLTINIQLHTSQSMEIGGEVNSASVDVKMTWNLVKASL